MPHRLAGPYESDAGGAGGPSAQSEGAPASAEQGRGRGPKYVPDEVLVRFRPGIPRAWRGTAHASLQGQVKREYGSIEGLELVKLPPGLSVSEAIDRYRQRPEVLYAEPNYPIYPALTPNDTSFGLQWALNNTGQVVNGQAGTADADIDAPEAWNITQGSNTVVI
ncbi:MAG: S8 family serine peptidase, partial [Candidatus Acidiferrales bacterium]